MHCNFGIDVINTKTRESASVGSGFRDEIQGFMQQGVELEYRYAEATMPHGVLGLNASMFKEYQTGGVLRWCDWSRISHAG